MTDLIGTITQTRETASKILVKSLINLEKNSEIEIRDKILSEIATHKELFPGGWYDPPFKGVAVLLAQKPFKRLQFESLRKPEAWPNKTSKFEKETVGIIHISPVDSKTGMLGDIGCTIYVGDDKEIKEHIKKCYDTILSIAERAEVGMKFSDLYKFSMDLFQSNLKIIGWMTTTSDPNLGINLGHTVPGSFENNLTFGNTFEQIRDTIKTNRIYINEVESFKIPNTCAFTVEARLADLNNPDLPNTFFHFMVCFSEGKKTILENFAKIFDAVGMDYMHVK